MRDQDDPSGHLLTAALLIATGYVNIYNYHHGKKVKRVRTPTYYPLLGFLLLVLGVNSVHTS